MGYDKLYKGNGKSSIQEYFRKSNDAGFLDAIDYFFHVIEKSYVL